MEYFCTTLEKLWAGDLQGGRTAYAETLSKHHNLAQKAVFKAAIMGVPSKDAICGMKHLLTESGASEDQQRALIEKEVGEAMQVFAPLVREAIAMNRAAG